MLYPGVKHVLMPGSQFRLGDLEFKLERYNTAVSEHAKYQRGSDDRHKIIQDIGIDEHMKWSYFAVYDGHGGPFCSEYLRIYLHKVFKRNLMDRFDGIKNTKNMARTIKNIFEQTFFQVDNMFAFNSHPTDLGGLDLKEMNTKISNIEIGTKTKKWGSTAVWVFIIGDRIYCANVGDSRAILSRGGQAIELSWDHKLAREDEKKRVKDLGDLSWGKVWGYLSVTRAFGDWQYKFTNELKTLGYRSLIVKPEVREHVIDPFKDEFIVIASDGLFDQMQSQQVVSFVREKYENTPESITQDLLNETLEIRENKDDITIILIKLQRHL